MEFRKDSIRLFCEIDLETNVVEWLLVVTMECDDGDEVDECGAVLFVVDDAGLAVLSSDKRLAEEIGRILRGESARLAFGYLTAWCLKKSAIPTNDLWFCITSEGAKIGGAVDDGSVVSACIGDDERSGEVHRAQMDGGVGSVMDTRENRDDIETRDRIYGKAVRGWDGEGREQAKIWLDSGRRWRKRDVGVRKIKWGRGGLKLLSRRGLLVIILEKTNRVLG